MASDLVRLISACQFELFVWMDEIKKRFDDFFASLKQKASQKSMCGILNVLKCFNKNIQKFTDSQKSKNK